MNVFWNVNCNNQVEQGKWNHVNINSTIRL